MKALEKIIPGAIAMGWISDKEASELSRLVEVNAELLVALEKAQQDINWMLNERKFLNGDVFNYIDESIAKAKEQQ